MDQELKSLQTSAIRTWIGICAETKASNAITLEVFIPELFPTLTGGISSASTTQNFSLTDLEGNPIQDSVETKTSVTAYYHGGTTNRPYPPDVVAGEQVEITQYSNAGRYYWSSLGRDDRLRTTETYRLEAKNRKNFTDPCDDAHTYSFELDTKVNQHIRLLTSNGNGEAYTYVFKLDAKNSKVQLSDNIGNAVTIDSANAKVIVQNSQNAFLMLNGLDILMASPRDITIKATRQLLIQSPLITVANTTGAGILAIQSQAIAISASKDITTTSPAIGLNGAVQMPNTLAVNSLRANLITGGEIGQLYASGTINLSQGTGTIPNITQDAAMPINRHAVAYEQFEQIMNLVVQAFNDIRSSIGVPTTEQQNITALISPSEMSNLTGV